MPSTSVKMNYSSTFILDDCLNLKKEDIVSKHTSNIHTTTIAQEYLQLPDSQDSHKLCKSVDSILSTQECNAIIARAEEAGFKPALLNTGFGIEVYRPELRSSDRCIIDDIPFAEHMFERVREVLPETFEERNTGWKICGLNERMRILRYEKGNSFPPHFDGCFRRNNGMEQSFHTVMIYLNSGGEDGSFQGGSTVFHSRTSNENFTDYVPRCGSMLVFDHELLHEGALLERGVKYAIRTDVMYTRQDLRERIVSKTKILSATLYSKITNLSQDGRELTSSKTIANP